MVQLGFGVVQGVKGVIRVLVQKISLTKIEPRLHQNRIIKLVENVNMGTTKYFEYMFYMVFDASMVKVKVRNALMEVQKFTSFLRVIGCYTMYMTPWCLSGQPFFFFSFSFFGIEIISSILFLFSPNRLMKDVCMYYNIDESRRAIVRCN